MENFKINALPEMEDEELQSLVKQLEQSFKQSQANFALSCYSIYRVWKYCKGRYFKSKNEEYYNSYLLLAKFGFDKKAVSRYVNCFERFCFCTLDGKDIKLLDQYQTYSPSKLYELLPLTDDCIANCFEQKIIHSNMTVKEIRNEVKFLIHGEEAPQQADPNLNTDEINEEEIPMAYDPSKEYEFEYFKSKSKNQLLNMIWELQKVYQKLKKK